MNSDSAADQNRDFLSVAIADQQHRQRPARRSVGTMKGLETVHENVAPRVISPQTR